MSYYVCYGPRSSLDHHKFFRIQTEEVLDWPTTPEHGLFGTEEKLGQPQLSYGFN